MFVILKGDGCQCSSIISFKQLIKLEECVYYDNSNNYYMLNEWVI